MPDDKTVLMQAVKMNLFIEKTIANTATVKCANCEAKTPECGTIEFQENGGKFDCNLVGEFDLKAKEVQNSQDFFGITRKNSYAFIDGENVVSVDIYVDAKNMFMDFLKPAYEKRGSK